MIITAEALACRPTVPATATAAILAASATAPVAWEF